MRAMMGGINIWKFIVFGFWVFDMNFLDILVIMIIIRNNEYVYCMLCFLKCIYVVVL